MGGTDWRILRCFYLLESDYRNIYRFNGDPATPVAEPSGWVQGSFAAWHGGRHGD